MTLLDALRSWLLANGNNGRPASAISGRKTAITLAAAALGGKPEEVTIEQLSAFDDTALEELLRTGAKKLGRKPAQGKTLANYTSYLRNTLAHVTGSRKKYAPLNTNHAPTYSFRPSVGSYQDLPTGIRSVIDDIIDWKTQKALPQEEERFQKNIWNPTTADSNRRLLVRYAHKLLRLLEVDDLTLFELVRRDNFIAWRQSEEANDRSRVAINGRPLMKGHASAARLADTLVAVAGHYMRAKEPGWLEQEEVEANGEHLAAFFFRKALQLRELHARQTSSRTKVDVSHLVPKDFWDLGVRVFNSADSLTALHSRIQRSQTHTRKRTALVYAVGSITPLRMRNFREMRWGQHLRRLRDGRWEVRFSGDELKVPTRKQEINVYKHTYGKQLSALIDAYLEWLKTTYGQDIQQRAPYVFTKDPEVKGYDLHQPLSDSSFLRSFDGLWRSAKGEKITPHRLRDVVATYLIRWGIANGKDGLALAAHALGDTVQAVIDNYYRPNIEAFTAYEDHLTSDDDDEDDEGDTGS